MDFTAIDFETANQHPVSACAIGVTTVRGGRAMEPKRWLIRPEPLIFAPFNIAIHGITPDQVADAPTFRALWPELAPALEGQIVAAHNAPFDVGVLRRTLEHYRLPLPEMRILCSCCLSRAAFPDLYNHKLNTVCGYLDIPLRHHDCASDAAGCAGIICRVMAENGLETLEELEARFAVRAGELRTTGEYRPCRGPSAGGRYTRRRRPYPWW